MLPVTSLHSLSRHRHLAMALAVLALFAQLWTGQASAAHLAQMLSEQFLRGDVCTVQPLAHDGDPVPDGPQGGHAMGSALSCPVCSVAGAGFTPVGTAPVVAALQAQALYRAGFASATARAPRHANLRPPAHAPPRAWI